MAKLKILQIGTDDWRPDLTLPEHVDWLYSSVDGLADFLDSLKRAAFAKLSATQAEELGSPSKVRLGFSGVLLTSPAREEELEILKPMVEAYGIFYDQGVVLPAGQATGFFRQKVVRELPCQGSRQEKLDYLALLLFPSQYGAKLKVPEIDVNPGFKGQVAYDGNVGVIFSGDFGQEFTPLFTFRYNLSSFPTDLELWPEYVKRGDCELRMEIVCMRTGSLGDIVDRYYVYEKDMVEPYLLKRSDEVGYYSVSISARGQGKIKCGAVHWRYSRRELGRFVLGGKRHSDAKRQEVFYYFNPGDMKPPLNVYFSGFRGAEGFEGFGMMKGLKAPFVLVADPRLEGGCFYSGTDELEGYVQDAIQESLDYLGFESNQLILSGLSMGAFGAVYYASHFNPHGVVVGKPFTNLGDTVRGLKLKRPDEFETSGDMLKNVIGASTEEAMERFNQRFWDKFSQSDFPDTKFAIAYMEQDDYDGGAIERLIEHLSESEAHIFAKGYEGRHNDNSRSINKWFITQYHKMLKEDFGRK